MLLGLISTLIIAVIYETGSPFIYKKIFDELFPHKHILWMAELFGLLCLAFMAYAITNIIQSLLTIRLFSSLTNELRLKVFYYIQKTYLETNAQETKSGLLETFTQDIHFIEHVGIHVMWIVAKYVLTGVFSSIFLLILNWRMALYLIVVLFLTLISSFFLTREVKKTESKEEINEADLLNIVIEEQAVQNVVQAFRLGNYRRKHFKDLLKAFSKYIYPQHLQLLISTRSMLLTTSLAQLLFFGGSIYFVITGYMTLGELVGIFFLLGNISSSINLLSSNYSILSHAAAKWTHLTQMLQIKARKSQKHLGKKIMPPFSKGIVFEDVCAAYGNKAVLFDINPIIKAGESVAFIGPSGAGKSTLLKILWGEIPISSGRLLFDGIDMQNLSLRSIRAQSSVVSQDIQLFALSIQDNIRMGKLNATQAEIIAAAKLAEIHEDIIHLPDGYATKLIDTHQQLSTGQLQRIAIARALIARPAILYLDEATSALDPLSGAAIDATLKRVAKYSTIIAVTHRLESAANMDLIYVLDKGCIIESGNHKELIKQGGLYSKLWEKQHGILLSANMQEVTIIPKWLRTIPIFSPLSDEILNWLSKEFVLEKFQPDNYIVHQGTIGRKFYIIATGIVEVFTYQEQTHEKKMLAKLTDGDFFGEIALLYETKRTANVIAKSVCLILSLTKQQAHKIFAVLPQETINLIKQKAEERFASKK